MREAAELDEDTFSAALAKIKHDRSSLFKKDLRTQVMRNGTVENSRIVNGISTVSFPAVGAVIRVQKGNKEGEICTGSLVGCDKVLTAAHCVVGAANQKNYSVYFQHAGVFKVRQIDWLKKDYVPALAADFAVLTTEQPISAITPLQLNTLSTPLIGTKGTIVGYGSTGGDDLKVGMKRLGYVKTSQCPTKYQESRLICWAFDAFVQNGQRPSNTCAGDSGGPLLLESGQTDSLIGGVTTSGLVRSCLTGDNALDLDVSAYQEAISGFVRSDASCSASGLSRYPILAESGYLDEAHDRALYSVPIETELSQLIVSMNAEQDQNSIRFELSVFREGTKPQRSNCSVNQPPQFASCSFLKPTKGKWTIEVKRKAGRGAFQVIANRQGAK